MRRSSVLIGAVLFAPALASADLAARAIKANGAAGMYDVVASAPNQDDLIFARQLVPPTQPPTTGGTSSALALSKVIYLNKNGVTLQPGNNDSRTNRSTLANQTVSIPAWNVSATTWTATVNCMKELFAPFDVQIVETDPGTTVQHIEAVFGGSPQALGMPANVAGVSPFTTNCSIIENSIVFTFTNVIPADARLACEIQAQEVAHSFGLDHELLAADPMTYLDYNGNRSFQNQAASCGENTVRACGINGSVCRPDQNSVVLLTERLGTKGQPGDTIAPTVGITSPTPGATVPPGFKVSFTATDNIAVTMASIYIDGVASGSVMMEREFTTPTLPDGMHTIRVEVTDGINQQSSEVTVTVRKGASPTPPPGGGDPDNSGADADDVAGGCAAGDTSAGIVIAFGVLLMLGLRNMFRRQAMLDSLQPARRRR